MSFLFFLAALPLLFVLILVHEIGHFWAARWMGVRIEEFGIGFPPRMLKLGEKNGVLYTLNWLPLGGFCKLAGEEDPNVEGSLASKKPWRRIIVLAAGAFMNLVLAFALYTGLAVYGQPEAASKQVGITQVVQGSAAEEYGLKVKDIIIAINGRPMTTDQEIRTEILLNRGYTMTVTVERDGQREDVKVVPRKVEQGALGIYMTYYESPVTVQQVYSPAREAGLQPGDVITALDGQPVQNSLDYGAYLHSHLGQDIAVSVERNGQPLGPITLYNTSAVTAENSLLGIDYIRTVMHHYSLGQALAKAGSDTLDAAILIPRTIASIFRGSVPVSDLSGPVGIVVIGAQVAKQSGLYGMVVLGALISVNLFLVNLLPIPALDGGRMLFVVLEWIRGGKRIPPEKEGLVHMIGFVILLLFVAFITYFDIMRAIKGGP